MIERFCNEGLDIMPGNAILTSLESKIVAAIMEQIIEGNDVSWFAEEASVVLGALQQQCVED